jgi:hypothetical protein
LLALWAVELSKGSFKFGIAAGRVNLSRSSKAFGTALKVSEMKAHSSLYSKCAEVAVELGQYVSHQFLRSLVAPNHSMQRFDWS